MESTPEQSTGRLSASLIPASAGSLFLRALLEARSRRQLSLLRRYGASALRIEVGGDSCPLCGWRDPVSGGRKARNCWSSRAILPRRWLSTKSRAPPGFAVIGVVEPGAEAAAAASKKQKVVVIGTEATVSSHAYRRALEGSKIEAREKACPLFVPLGRRRMDRSSCHRTGGAHLFGRSLLRTERSMPMFLLLGCTHYPLIKPLAEPSCARTRCDCGFCGINR